MISIVNPVTKVIDNLTILEKSRKRPVKDITAKRPSKLAAKSGFPVVRIIGLYCVFHFKKSILIFILGIYFYTKSSKNNLKGPEFVNTGE